MQNELNWLVSQSNIIVNFDGQTHIVPNKGNMGAQLIQALKDKDENQVQNLVDVAKRLEKESDGLFTAEDGEIKAHGEKVHRSVEQKIAEFMEEGLPYEPLKNFLEKVKQNPSERSREQLYNFLEKNNMPVASDGDFIAYKKVRWDFKDCHSGRFDNSPGQILEMPRDKVCADPNTHCGSGFHAACWEYAEGFGEGPMLEVKINPKDVVSVPFDLNQKIRCCRYEVLRQVDQENSSTLYDKPVSTTQLGSEVSRCAECDIELVAGEDDLCVECADLVGCEDCGEKFVAEEISTEGLCADCEDTREEDNEDHR
jgi:hypothetical protein